MILSYLIKYFNCVFFCNLILIHMFIFSLTSFFFFFIELFAYSSLFFSFFFIFLALTNESNPYRKVTKKSRNQGPQSAASADDFDCTILGNKFRIEFK